MATTPLKPRTAVEEYLRTVYRPDCDYTDGVVEERTLGEQDHSNIQSNLVTWFRSRYKTTGIKAWVEWRFQLSPTKFRVPDVTVMRGDSREKILTTTPLLIIDVLSPEDRYTRVMTRVQEYLSVGVPVVWLVDAELRTISAHRGMGAEQLADPAPIGGTDLAITFTEVFD